MIIKLIKTEIFFKENLNKKYLKRERKIKKYIEYHDNPFPEIVKDLMFIGITYIFNFINDILYYSIFTFKRIIA